MGQEEEEQQAQLWPFPRLPHYLPWQWAALHGQTMHCCYYGNGRANEGVYWKKGSSNTVAVFAGGLLAFSTMGVGVGVPGATVVVVVRVGRKVARTVVDGLSTVVTGVTVRVTSVVAMDE